MIIMYDNNKSKKFVPLLEEVGVVELNVTVGIFSGLYFTCQVVVTTILCGS